MRVLVKSKRHEELVKGKRLALKAKKEVKEVVEPKKPKKKNG